MGNVALKKSVQFALRVLLVKVAFEADEFRGLLTGKHSASLEDSANEMAREGAMLLPTGNDL